MQIVDGQKVIVCKLRVNHYKMKSVAYPIDEQRLPEWFMDLPFDDAGMESSIIDKKVDNLLSVLKWKLHEETATNVYDSLFE